MRRVESLGVWCGAVAALLRATAAGAQCPDTSMLPAVDAPLDVVRYLAHDALAGRRAGSAGERCAADFIAARFRAIGLRPGGEDGTYFQQVRIASVVDPHATPGTGRNVIGVLEGTTPFAGIVVVGAHHDHLGMGGSGSLAPGVEAVHNGADDNASGVAALLEVAERLASGARPRRTVVFVTFTGEELGLLGSARFAADVIRMNAMLNLDMVGRLENRALIVYGLDTAVEWRTLVADAARAEGIPLALEDDGFGPSDHTSFYARGVPVLHFFSNVHAQYHRPEDDWDRIDVAGLRRVADLVTRIARHIADSDIDLTPQAGAGTPPATNAQGYGTYLGSVPDFTPVERGVRLTGVSPGSPAERAGLAAGDILIGLGEHEVADLQGLTDALRAHRPGDRVVVRFIREGERRQVEVVLGRRGG